MPFGISPGPDVFYPMVGDVVENLTGVIHFVDDVLVWGDMQEEHDDRLRKALACLSEAGFAINTDKCEINKTEVTFLGHIVNGHLI